MLFQNSIQLFWCCDTIDESDIQGIVSSNWLGQEEHLAGLVNAQLVDEMHDTRGIVGDAYLGRGDGEGGIIAADNHVARKAQVAGTSPHTATDTRNNRDWRLLDTTQELLHGDIVCQGVFTGNSRMSWPALQTPLRHWALITIPTHSSS